MTRTVGVTLVVSSLLAIAAGRKPERPDTSPPPAKTTIEAASNDRTVLQIPIVAKSGSTLSGKATLTELAGGGVRVVVDVAGVAPGEHGVHIHENADCSAPDASSAGEHFNPDHHPHGLPPSEPRHLGDFGNIDVGEDGTGHLEIVVPRANLRPADPHSFLGRSIIVHAKPDVGSQPSGAAGARIGCGEIRRADR